MTSPNPDPVVEELAQRKFRLESFLEAHSAELRKDSTNVSESYERMQQGFAQPGDQWIPSDAAEKEQNVRLMEEMCTKPPTSIDE